MYFTQSHFFFPFAAGAAGAVFLGVAGAFGTPPLGGPVRLERFVACFGSSSASSVYENPNSSTSSSSSSTPFSRSVRFPLPTANGRELTILR